MVDIVANQQGPGEGSSYIPDSGEYYLDINALGSWSLEVVTE